MLRYIIQFYKAMQKYFKRVIHPRRLIIASEKKVMQFTVGVRLQTGVLLLIIGSVFWSSYATGRFISAKNTLEAQSNTIRSVVAVRANNLLSSLLPSSVLSKGVTNNLDNISAMSDLNKNRVRLTELEKQVDELKNENEAIVERVRVKTGGQLEDLESIVSQTGLNPHSIKKRLDKDQKTNKETAKYDSKNEAEGGPYIPSHMPKISDNASEMLDSLDDLRNLRQVVANLPLGIPVKNAEERSQFGHRIDPFNGDVAFHSGLDLAASFGSSIHSTADGTVISAGRDGSYGNMVDIDHGFGVVTRYGHMSEINVNKGDKVKKDSIIGVQGSTGRSTGPHLHYEVRYNGVAINPEKFLQTGRLLELGSAVSQN